MPPTILTIDQILVGDGSENNDDDEDGGEEVDNDGMMMMMMVVMMMMMVMMMMKKIDDDGVSRSVPQAVRLSSILCVACSLWPVDEEKSWSQSPSKTHFSRKNCYLAEIKYIWRASTGP